MDNKLQDQYTDIQFKNALICELELISGKQTKVITAYNSTDINFELLNRGMTVLLSECENVVKIKNTICTYKEGKLKPVFSFKEHIFKR